jgi:pyocin large subunit-like protein
VRQILPVIALAALLGACDAGPNAAASAPKASATAAAPGVEASAPAPRAEPVRLVAGKPLWTSNRRMSAEDSARSHFERDGADFDAKSVDDFVAKAHAFADRPPKGVLKIERRNGDRLLYDPKANVFLVVTRTGAPRTMFKPRDGKAYWDRQVRIEAEKSAAR